MKDSAVSVDIAKQVIQVASQPALVLDRALSIKATNFAFDKLFPPALDFFNQLENQEQLKTRLQKLPEEPVEHICTLKGTNPIYAKWRFQFQEELQHYIVFGEIFEDSTASVRKVAESLKSTGGDITDIAKHLAANMDKFQLLADNISDVVCLHHPEDARYLYVSPSVKSLVGYEPHELEGRTPYEFFHPDFIKFLEEDHQRSAAGEASSGPPPKMDVMLITKSGERKWASVHSQPLFDEDGNVALIISSSRDISPRKMMEEELIQKNGELNAFSYRISHDLRSPLTTIMTLFNLIRDEEDVIKIKEFALHVNEKVHLIDQMIHSIMDYAKNSNRPLSASNFELPAEVPEVLSAYSHHPNFMKLNLDIDYNEVRKVSLDLERFKVILNCLISNSFNFLDNKKSVHMAQLSFKLIDKQLEISLRDNGVGVKEDIKDKIFEMFFRGSTLSRGAGLGLYLLKETVEKMKGTLKLDTVEEEGSTFTILLPISE